jgi:hypothetical protein
MQLNRDAEPDCQVYVTTNLEAGLAGRNRWWTTNRTVLDPYPTNN